MKFAIVGMKHCGSTMVTNMVRIALKMSGHTINNEIEDNELIKLQEIDNKTEYSVRKCHEFCNDFIVQGYKLISPIRDIRDCSMTHFYRFCTTKYCDRPLSTDIVRMEGLYTFIRHMEDNIRLFEIWESHKPFHFHYEKYKKQPDEETKRLMMFLGLSTEKNFVREVIERTEKYKERNDLLANVQEFKTHEQKTYDLLLTKDHITSGGRIEKYKHFFDKREQEMILENDKIQEFLVSYGYSTFINGND